MSGYHGRTRYQHGAIYHHLQPLILGSRITGRQALFLGHVLAEPNNLLWFLA